MTSRRSKSSIVHAKVRGIVQLSRSISWTPSGPLSAPSRRWSSRKLKPSHTGHGPWDERHDRAVRRQRMVGFALAAWLALFALIGLGLFLLGCAALPPGLSQDRATCARYEIQSCGDPANPATFSCRSSARRACLRALGWEHERGQWVKHRTDADRAREIEEASHEE